MTSKLKRFAVGAAALALLATAAPLLTPSPAFAAGAPQNPGATIKNPGGGTNFVSGDSSSNFTLRLPAGASCTGDTSGGEYFVQSYAVPASVDPSTLQFDSSGPVPNGVGASFRNPMYTTTGSPYVDQPTDVATSPGGPGAIINIPDFTFSVYGPGDMPAGAYNVGIACTKGPASGTQMKEFWNATLTVSTPGGGPGAFNWSAGAAPAAPVLTSPLTAGDGTLTAAFTHAASTPASTYAATATPSASDTDCTGGGAVPVTTAPPVSASPIAISSLVNGCDYAVTVTASNGVGTATSNSVTGTPTPAVRPGVTNLQAVPGTGSVSLTWTAPAPASPARNGYAVRWENPIGTVIGSGTAAAGDTSFPVGGLTAGQTYRFFVTPTYPSPYTASTVFVDGVPNAAQTIYQHIEVTRPVGTLVLTQRCGVFGPLDQEGATADFPLLPAEAGVGATFDPTAPTNNGGTAPTTDWSDASFSGTTADGSFGEYPYPIDEATGQPNATYPTHCGVDLKIGKLITNGAHAGQYFNAVGRLNQITVVQTDDLDPAWTVNGKMSDFQLVSGTGSFSGKALGWTPKLNFRTAPIDTDFDGAPDYTPDATAGTPAAPGVTGLGSSGKALGSATGGHGLGIAQFDARLKVLIPVNAVNGRYVGTLTFTAV